MKDADGFWVGDYWGVIAFGIQRLAWSLTATPKRLGRHPQGLGAAGAGVAMNGDPADVRLGVRRRVLGGPGPRRLAGQHHARHQYFADLKKSGNFITVLTPPRRTVANGQTPVTIDWDYLQGCLRHRVQGQARVEGVGPVVRGVRQLLLPGDQRVLEAPVRRPAVAGVLLLRPGPAALAQGVHAPGPVPGPGQAREDPGEPLSSSCRRPQNYKNVKFPKLGPEPTKAKAVVQAKLASRWCSAEPLAGVCEHASARHRARPFPPRRTTFRRGGGMPARLARRGPVPGLRDCAFLLGPGGRPSMVGVFLYETSGSWSLDDIHKILNQGLSFATPTCTSIEVSLGRRRGSAALIGLPDGLRDDRSAASPRVLRTVVTAFSGVPANFAGVPLAFAFIATLGYQRDRDPVPLRPPGASTCTSAGISSRSLRLLWGVVLAYVYFQIPLMILVVAPGHRRAQAGVARGSPESLGASSVDLYWWRGRPPGRDAGAARCVLPALRQRVLGLRDGRGR